MNPFEVIVVAVSGALMISVVSNFLITVDKKSEVINQLDLLNVLNIRERGLNLNASFKAVYTPVINGTLIITSSSIKLNNASQNITGMRPINCKYESLLITEVGVNCLKQ